MNLKTILLWCVTALLCSCEHEQENPYSPLPEPVPEIGTRTVLAYIAADNSLSSFSTIDIKEMTEGMKKVDTRKNNLLVYVDRYGTNPRLIRICRDGADKIILDTLVTYTDASRNSVGVTEMKEVLAYTFDTFPSESYGFVLWSHGDGWLPASSTNTRWIGQDTDNGRKDKRLNIDDLRIVMESQPHHFDYILFDACYMQSIEVAYELRHCADYFIGSPTEIPGPGAPYQKVVPSLFAKNDAAITIAAAYFDFYESTYKKGEAISDANWTGGVSMSVLQSSKLEALAAASRRIPLYSSAKSTDGILCYDQLRSRNYHDMAGLVKSLSADASVYGNWEMAYKDALVYAKTTDRNYNTSSFGEGRMVSMDGFTGISTYQFSGSQNFQEAYYKTLGWYTASGGL